MSDIRKEDCIARKDFGFVAWLSVIKDIPDVPELRERIRNGVGRYWYNMSREDMFKLKNEYDQSGYIEVWIKAKRLKDLTF